MTTTLRRSNPVLYFSAGLVLCLLPLVFWWYKTSSSTGGTLSYPLDDTYIHLEIAGNLAREGNWGLNPNEFSAASSSILYTLLLAAGILAFGMQSWLPLLVNILAAAVLLYVFARWLSRRQYRGRTAWLLLFSMAFIIPLPILIWSGMEHTVQCLFCFLLFTQWLKADESRKPVWIFLLLAALVTAIRYEGLFLTGALALLSITRGRWKEGVCILLGALLPVIAFGLYSLSKGSYFFPNSLLVKADPAAGGIIHSLQHILIDKLIVGSTVITYIATQRLLIFLALVFFLFRGSAESRQKDGLVVVIITMVLHLSFASTGWFYRYEAYLVMLALVALAPYIEQVWFTERRSWINWALPVLALLLLAPLALRSAAAFTKAPQASVNIYEQQGAMTRFLQKHFPGEAVAANDVGAIALGTNSYIVDLWGLASIDVTRARKEGKWNGAFLDSFARAKGARIAIIYESWFTKDLTVRWKKAGNWKVQNNVILGDDHVSFFAIDSSMLPRLDQALRTYQAQLPPSVNPSYTLDSLRNPGH